MKQRLDKLSVGSSNPSSTGSTTNPIYRPNATKPDDEMKTTALSSLLLVGAAATLAAATPAQRPSNRMSPYDVPTANYVPLKPVTPSEPEHARIARMRAARRRWSRREPASGELAVSPHGYHDNGSPRVLKPRHLQQLGPMERPGTGPGENPRMMTNYKDIYYIIEILAGTQAISVSVDTGSSDTWFIQSGVQCVDYLYRPQPVSSEPQASRRPTAR